VRAELVNTVSACGDADCPSANATTALDVGGRVSNDDHLPSGHIDAEAFAGAALRDRGELRSILVIRAERADHKELGIDADGAQLHPRPLDEIPRQESKRDIRPP
jgi:hypothetical protein